MTAANADNSLGETLGLAPGQRAWFRDMPADILAALDPDGHGVHVMDAPSAGLDYAHIFVSDADTLEREVAALAGLLAASGVLWVSWPRAGAAIGENHVRAAAAPHGLEPADASAIGDDWSALKLIHAREGR